MLGEAAGKVHYEKEKNEQMKVPQGFSLALWEWGKKLVKL